MLRKLNLFYEYAILLSKGLQSNIYCGHKFVHPFRTPKQSVTKKLTGLCFTVNKEIAVHAHEINVYVHIYIHIHKHKNR